MPKKKYTLIQEREAFDAQLGEILESHRGDFALVKNGVVLEFFPNHESAYAAGLERFGIDTPFLIALVEETSPEPVSLAWDAGVMFG